METSDLHNFGQSVQKIGRGSEILFQKPRPIYWEWLFFGKSSPLSNFFDKVSGPKISLRNVIFNLTTEFGPGYSGSSIEVAPANTETVLPSHYYSLGVLLAYSYIFGIRDLHRHNLVKTQTHLQVIDAEVVFSRLILPHETLLLPFKEVGHALCGASALLDIGCLSEEQANLIFNGYFDLFQAVLGRLPDIRSTIESLPHLNEIPIRHILRDTFHYRAWKTNEPSIPFFESELIQLRRGDIPYYFKFLGQVEVHEYADAVGTFSPVPLPEIFLKGAARDAQLPSFLLNELRLTQLFGQGFLFIGKVLLENHSTASIGGNGYELKLNETSVSIDSSFGIYSALRR